MKVRYDKGSESFILSDATRIEYNQMAIWLTRHVKGYKFIPAYKMGVWSGQQTYFDNGRIKLGLWKEILKGCQEIGVPLVIENKEDFPINRDITLEKVTEFCKEFFKNHKVKKNDDTWVDFMPYEHQIMSAFKILKNRYCMAEVATSGGKSLIISIVIFYTLKHIDPLAKFLIIVPSITLVTQFYDNIFEYNFGTNNIEKEITPDTPSTPCDVRVEEIMSDRPRKYGGVDNPNIYIGTYQSLEKRDKKFFQQFHTVITDECHQAKAKTYLRILGYTVGHAYSRFGVSGTTPPSDSCEILTLQSVMGPTIGEVTATELKDKGIITPMEIKSIIMNHNDSDFGMRIKQIRKAGMGKEALDLEKDYIHISEKRMAFIKKIVSKFNNNSLILFYTIEYGKALLKELSSEFKDYHFYYIDGEVSGKRREEIKKELEINDDKVKILIASYGTLSTGVSIKNLHQLILADSFKSEQIIIQSIGRLLRLFDGKDKAIIYDLVDVYKSDSPQNILYTHYIERQKFYRKRQYPFKEYKVNL